MWRDLVAVVLCQDWTFKTAERKLSPNTCVDRENPTAIGHLQLPKVQMGRGSFQNVVMWLAKSTQLLLLPQRGVDSRRYK